MLSYFSCLTGMVKLQQAQLLLPMSPRFLHKRKLFKQRRSYKLANKWSTMLLSIVYTIFKINSTAELYIFVHFETPSSQFLSGILKLAQNSLSTCKEQHLKY